MSRIIIVEMPDDSPEELTETADTLERFFRDIRAEATATPILQPVLAAAISEEVKRLDPQSNSPEPSWWENDSIQFPRLLSELIASQDKLDLQAVADAMDLPVERVNELFDRAQRRWEAIKVKC